METMRLIKASRIPTRTLVTLLFATQFGLQACVDTTPTNSKPTSDQETLRPATDHGMPPRPADMDHPEDMMVEQSLDAGDAPLDMTEDMVGTDLGQPEACKLAIANVYWMVEYIQAVDSAWMDLRETPVGPRDEEGVERFVGVIKERHERAGGVTRRWFNLEAKDKETYTPYARLMLREWEGHALPELVVGDEVLIERHTSLARCDLPNEDGELTTLLFTTIKDANTGDLIHVEGDALLLPSGSIQLPTIAPIPSQRWSWHRARECTTSPTAPFTSVSIETAGGPSITPGETTIEGLDLFTFYLSGHLDPKPGTCGLWQFYATPRSP